MNRKILITGATGLIGSYICKELNKQGDTLTIFTRNPEKAKSKLPFGREFVKWDYHKPNEWKDHLNNKDIIIHLAGANLAGKQWTEEYKKKIVESREISTRNLVYAVGKADSKPKTFICASGVNYYGDKGEELLTEESNHGNDFLSNVCVIWEREAQNVEKYKVRRVSVRTGAVLSTEDGALKKMLTPFKFFVGGQLGSGEQWFSWVHLNDVVKGYLFLIDNESINGAVNVTSPYPVRNKEFASTLGKVLNRPSIFKVPETVLNLFFGEMAITVTGSLRVVPKKLERNNFSFNFEKLEEALRDLI